MHTVYAGCDVCIYVFTESCGTVCAMARAMRKTELYCGPRAPPRTGRSTPQLHLCTHCTVRRTLYPSVTVECLRYPMCGCGVRYPREPRRSHVRLQHGTLYLYLKVCKLYKPCSSSKLT